MIGTSRRVDIEVFNFYCVLFYVFMGEFPRVDDLFDDRILRILTVSPIYSNEIGMKLEWLQISLVPPERNMKLSVRLISGARTLAN